MVHKSFSSNVGYVIFRIMKYFFFYILFEGFYIYYYVENSYWSDNFDSFKTELNETGQATIFYLYAVTLTQYI